MKVTLCMNRMDTVFSWAIIRSSNSDSCLHAAIFKPRHDGNSNTMLTIHVPVVSLHAERHALTIEGNINNNNMHNMFAS